MLDRVDANGRAMTSEIPQSQQEAIDRAALILAQALTDAEVLIATEREAHAQRIPPQLVETLDRFGDVLSKLVEMTERLGDRVNDLTGAVGALATAHPPTLVYVSCDVATLARDLGTLVGAGYVLDTVELFDLFPGTAHVETMARLTRSS